MHQFGSTIFINEYLILIKDVVDNEMKKWEKMGKFGDLTIEVCWNKRRLIDVEGKIVDEYIE